MVSRKKKVNLLSNLHQSQFPSTDVCAVRLDFETFSTVRDTVDQALEYNSCADPFTITSTSQGTSGQICGENAGQHIYWDLGRESTATATIRCEVVSHFIIPILQ